MVWSCIIGVSPQTWCLFLAALIGLRNLIEVNVYNVSNYGYCEVDRFGWGMFLGLGLTQGSYMNSWLCL